MSFRKLSDFSYFRRTFVCRNSNKILVNKHLLSKRMQTTEVRSKVDPISESSSNIQSWNKVYPFLIAKSNQNEHGFKENKETNSIIEERQVFIEQCLAHELIMDRDRAKAIYFLCKNYFNKNYPSNESIIQLFSFLKMFFTSDNLYYNPSPFTIPFNILYNRITILKELGFRTFDAAMVDSIQKYLHMTPKDLNTYFNYLGDHNCFDSLCKSLEIVGDDKKSLFKYITTNHNDINSLSLSELRYLCIAKYLSSLLKISFNRVEQACLRANRNLHELSLNTIKLNVNYLLKEFKYPANKVIHNGLFASLDPDNLQKLSTKLSPIVGPNSYDNLISSPTILKTEYEKIISNFELVKCKCNGKFFTRSMELLTMAPSKLKALFDEIESNEDIEKLNLHLLGSDYVVMNRNKILERIEAIKAEDIPLSYVPLSFFQSSEAEFTDFINDVITDADLRVRFYLEDVLDIDYEKVKNRLKTIPNLSAQKYNKQNAKKIVGFFISMNIPKEQIIDAIYLILFDYKQVKSAYFNACSRYDTTLHKNPNFFKHIFDYLLFMHSSSS